MANLHTSEPRVTRFLGRPSLHLMILLLLLFPGRTAMAESDLEPTSLADLSLEELLAITVSVASIETESIVETPAIVSRYEMADFEGMGLHTLSDVLSFVPGVFLMEGEFSTKQIAIRGIGEQWGQKLLFLLDGVPYWMPSHGKPPHLGIPLEAISHIEIIRGPGAVIYGSNATEGVVKVVTKKGVHTSVSVVGGSNLLLNATGSTYMKLSDDFEAGVGFELQRDDGYEALYSVTQPDGTVASRLNHRSYQVASVLGRARYRGLSAFVHAYRSETGNLSTGEEPSHLISKAVMAHANYHLDIKKYGINVYTDYNLFPLEMENAPRHGDGTRLGFDNNGLDNFRWRAGSNARLKLGRRLGLFAGAEYELRSSGTYHRLDVETGDIDITIMDGGRTSELSAFAQADYRRGPWRLLGGARLTDNEKGGLGLTPRAGIVRMLDEEQSFKLLYAVGFNSPTFIQTNLNIPGIFVGSPDLTAERLHTVDLAYSYASENNLFIANLYFLRAEDFIIAAPAEVGLTTANGQSFNRQGGELDYQYASGPLRVFVNLAYHHQGGQRIEGDPMALVIPMLTSNIGSRYRLGRHSVGGSVRFVSERDTLEPRFLVNASYGLSLKKFDLYLTVRNLFDQEVVDRHIEGNDPRLYPGGDGINVRAGARYRF